MKPRTLTPLAWLTVTTGAEPACTTSPTSNTPLQITVREIRVAVA